MLEVPAQFMNVRYDGSRFPGAPGVEGVSDGANCQQFAYTLLRHFGRSVPDMRSSDLWADETCTARVDDFEPLDLLLFSEDGQAWGAHVGVYLGEGKVIHLSVHVGHPEILDLADIQLIPRYQVLVGAKRTKPSI